eukprot:46046_1
MTTLLHTLLDMTIIYNLLKFKLKHYNMLYLELVMAVEQWKHIKQSFKYNGCNQGGFVRLSINNNFAKMYFYEGVSTSITFETGKWFPGPVYYTINQLTTTEIPTVATTDIILEPTDFPTIDPTAQTTDFPTVVPTISSPTENEYKTSIVLTSSTAIIVGSKFSETEILSSEYHDELDGNNEVDIWAFIIVILIVMAMCIVLLICVGMYLRKGLVTGQLLTTKISLVSLKKAYVRDDSDDIEGDAVDDTVTINCESGQNDIR